MKNILNNLNQLINNKKCIVGNTKLFKVIQSYSFLYISDECDIYQNNQVYQKIKESKVIMINYYKGLNENKDESHFIIAFKKTIIIINRDSISLLLPLFSNNPEIKICFLSNSKEIFDANINIKYNELKPNPYFKDEIKGFNENLPLIQSNYLWFIINSCISGYFIQESYLKLNKDRVLQYVLHKNESIENKIMTNEDYFELRSILSIKYGIIKLVYHVEYEEILIMKIFQDDSKDESFKYAKRELDNYSTISHPFLPKFYGKSKDEKSLFIEYINDQTLFDIKSLNLTENEKYTIILQMLSVFKYIHEKSLIYRDLKPNNVIIDKNKNLVLIDFDRMTSKYVNNEERTKDFASCFIAPETNSEFLTEKSDIYSIGLMIYYTYINLDLLILLCDFCFYILLSLVQCSDKLPIATKYRKSPKSKAKYI